MERPRIVTWRAVSSEEQARGEKESLNHQQQLNAQHVAQWGGVVVAELEVPGISRNIILWERACREIPAFAALNDLLERKAFDILMCMDVTRLARTSALLSVIAALCEAANVRIYETSSPPPSLDGPIATFDSRLITLLKGGMSEQEIRKTSERAAFGRQAQVKKGRHANTPPVGLKRVYNTLGESHTELDEDWRPLVTLFYELYLEHGRSQLAIANEFNARGLYAPGTNTPWDEYSIRVFLRNCWAYAGFVQWGRWAKNHPKHFRAKAEWDGFITEEQARRALEEQARRTQMPKSIGRPHRFSVMGKCGVCGSTMSATTAKSRKGTRSIRYRCRKSCRGGDVRETLVYEAIRAAIESLQTDANLESLIGETPSHYDGLTKTLTEAKAALVSVAKERTKLTTAFMRDAIRLDEYEPLMAELKARHDSISVTITNLEDLIAATPTAENRRQRLEEIRDSGTKMLDHPDHTTANAWLRRHFAFVGADNKVAIVKLL